MKEFRLAVRALQQENQRQRSQPDCLTEHWGWIPNKNDRVKILRQIGVFAEEVHELA